MSYRESTFSVWRPQVTCGTEMSPEKVCGHLLSLHPLKQGCTANGCGCGRFRWKKKAKKIHSKGQLHDGKQYGSDFEAKVVSDYRQQLDSGELTSLEFHKSMPLDVNGQTIRTYEVDIVAGRRDGTTEYVETKGKWLGESKMKRDHFVAQYINGNSLATYRVLTQKRWFRR